MRALLIVNKGGNRDFKLLVRIHSRELIRQVNALLSEDRQREAFEIFLNRAEVEDYIPPGRKIKQKPDVTFIEDMLG